MGWELGTLIYDKYNGPLDVELTTPVGKILLQVQRMRQQIEYYKNRALAQVQISKGEKSSIEAFEEYRKASFPFQETDEKKKERVQQEQLMEWITHGPISISKVNMPFSMSKKAQFASREQTEDRKVRGTSIDNPFSKRRKR